MTVISTENPWPLRPWVVAATTSRRLGEQLKVDNGLGTMTHSSSDTVVTSVTSTNDDDILALCTDVCIVLELRVEKRFGVELYAHQSDK